MTEFNSSPEKILEDLCKELLDEAPKLNAALKNMIAKFLGIPENADFLQESLAFSKLILKEFTEEVRQLGDVVQFGQKFPQSSDLSTDRFSELAKYKAVIFVRDKTASANLKPSTIFSKTFFRWTMCWPELKAKILTKGAAQFPDVQDMFLSFFTDFSLSLEEEVLYTIHSYTHTLIHSYTHSLIHSYTHTEL